MCTSTLVHAAATIPYLGINKRFNTKLNTNERLTVTTRATCLLEIVKILPNRVDTVRKINTMEKGSTNTVAYKYSGVYNNCKSSVLKVVNAKNSEHPTSNKYK